MEEKISEESVRVAAYNYTNSIREIPYKEAQDYAATNLTYRFGDVQDAFIAGINWYKKQVNNSQ